MAIAGTCPNCDHAEHDGARCTGRAECEGHDHACACNWPSSDNYAETA